MRSGSDEAGEVTSGTGRIVVQPDPAHTMMRRRARKEWGEARNKETTEFAQKNYPAMREITGQYLMREVTMK